MFGRKAVMTVTTGDYEITSSIILVRKGLNLGVADVCAKHSLVASGVEALGASTEKLNGTLVAVKVFRANVREMSAQELDQSKKDEAARLVAEAAVKKKASEDAAAAAKSAAASAPPPPPVTK